MARAQNGTTRREIAAELGIPLVDVDKPLTVARIGELLSIDQGTWRGYVKRANDARAAGRGRPGLAPAPDGREPLSGKPFWMPATIAAFKRDRPKQGTRTDLRRKS